jgi:hypothetical protein
MWHSLITQSERYKHWIVGMFFIIFLCLGVSIYRDYGLSGDNTHQKLLGEKSFNYIFYGDQELMDSRDIDHGPAFELVTTSLYKLMGMETDVQIYSFSELMVFLSFFVGAIFFYLLVQMRFNDWKVGLFGTLLLIVSPRIFESAFVNSKDIPFMVFSIISLYTLFKLDKKMRVWDAVIHGVVTGFLIAIRSLGIFMIGVTGLLLIFKLAVIFRGNSHQVGKHLLLFGAFLLLTVIVTYIFWPWLWPDPIGHFVYSVQSLSHYTTWNGQVLYMGQLYDPTKLPWHYTPVWIMVTTPLLYVFFAFVGGVYMIGRLVIEKINLMTFENRFDLITLCWIGAPLMAVAIFHSVLYSGWRHMFFIYPAILIVTLYGFIRFSGSLKKNFNSRLLSTMLNMALILSIVGTMWSMVVYHPYESTYFTILAGKNLKSARFRYGLDLYGLCAKEALEYLVDQNEPQHMLVYPSSVIFQRSAVIIPMYKRSRITWTGDFNKADFFVGAYMDRREAFIVPENYKLVYSVARGGVNLCVVYKNMDEK